MVIAKISWLGGLLALAAALGGHEKSLRVQDGKKPPEKKESWKILFDGKYLSGWKVANFGGEGEVEVEKGAILLGPGSLRFEGSFR